MTDTKFDKFQFDTDFFEVLSPADVARAEEAEQAKEQAYAEGFSAGQRKQQDEMQALLTQHVQMLQNIGTQMQAQHDAYSIALGRQALNIIDKIVNQLLDHAAEHFPQDILEKHLRDVIPQLPKNMPLTLKIHPDATTFHEKLGVPQANIQGCAFTIQPDPNVAPGDCIVLWETGGVEASLQQARQQLGNLLSKTPPDPNATIEEPATATTSPDEDEEKASPDAPQDEETNA